MNHYTTPCGLVFTPTEQCIFYVFWEILWKIENREDSSNGSVEAVVARWLSAPNLNFGSMMEYLQAHEDLRLEDVIYSLGDVKDFDEWISYVDEFELRNDRYTCKSFRLSLYKKTAQRHPKPAESSQSQPSGPNRGSGR